MTDGVAAKRGRDGVATKRDGAGTKRGRPGAGAGRGGVQAALPGVGELPVSSQAGSVSADRLARWVAGYYAEHAAVIGYGLRDGKCNCELCREVRAAGFIAASGAVPG